MMYSIKASPLRDAIQVKQESLNKPHTPTRELGRGGGAEDLGLLGLRAGFPAS
jgi:hypothetical protein